MSRNHKLTQKEVYSKYRNKKNFNDLTVRKRSQKKYKLPVIGHFKDRSIEFKNILEAERATGIHYTLIFEACIGKIYKAKNVVWEFKKGNHYIKYKAYYINAQEQLL